MAKLLDTAYLRDKQHCPLCAGHGVIDTEKSNAFGLGLNADVSMRNPYDLRTQFHQFNNFRLGKDCQTKETLKDLFERMA